MSRPRAAPEPRGAAVESVPDCIVRNHDADREYDLSVTLRDGDEVALERTVALDPDTTVSWPDAVPPGRYEVRAEVTAGPDAAGECTVDTTAGGTALIEVGNWHVSVTEGL